MNLTLTGTPGGPVGRAGQLLITGGAVSGDGSRLALRTYTDAYVWPLAGSDVPGALAAPPVRVRCRSRRRARRSASAPTASTSLVASEGLPSDLTVVPLPAAVAAAAATAAWATCRA